MQVWPPLNHLPVASRAAAPFDRIVPADDGRRLATEFQRQRGEVRRGRGHHLAPDGGGTGEHEVVERQAANAAPTSAAFGATATRSPGTPRPAVRAGRRWCAGVFGRLQVHVVAGGDGGRERHQRQVFTGSSTARSRRPRRPVPPVSARGQEAPARPPRGSIQPAQVPAQVVDLVEHGHAVGDQAFGFRAMAEVGGNRRGHSSSCRFSASRRRRRSSRRCPASGLRACQPRAGGRASGAVRRWGVGGDVHAPEYRRAHFRA